MLTLQVSAFGCRPDTSEWSDFYRVMWKVLENQDPLMSCETYSEVEVLGVIYRKPIGFL